MKLAYFSPLNHQKSGISDYSEALIPHLRKYYNIDLWVYGMKPNNPLLRGFNIIDYKNNKNIDKLREYDAVIYNIGNNPYFHAEIYDVFLKYPGVVILHDYVLYCLIVGYYLEFRKSREQLIKEFYYNYGEDGISSIKNILRKRETPLHFRSPELYPLIRRVVDNAVGIIVHSESTKDLIVLQGYPDSNVVKINQINYVIDNNKKTPEKYLFEMRSKYGVFYDDILVSSFGYIAPTKRNLEIIEAINDIVSVHGYTIKYLMVGEGNYVDGLLNDYIKKTGYIPINEFEGLLNCSDIIVNLRNPSMGETSATLIRAMAAGKPCIVTDIGWFSELPDDTVMKISSDIRSEKKELVNMLLQLIGDISMRSELGTRAKNFVLTYHDPEIIAAEINNFLNQFILWQNYNILNIYFKINSTRLNDLSLNKDKENKLSELYLKLNSNRLKEIGLIDYVLH